jgi:hypothetical protein
MATPMALATGTRGGGGRNPNGDFEMKSGSKWKIVHGIFLVRALPVVWLLAHRLFAPLKLNEESVVTTQKPCCPDSSGPLALGLFFFFS